MKQLLLNLLIVLSSYSSFSIGYIDSLKNKLKENISTQTKIDVLNELSWEININNPIEALTLAKQALSLSIKTNNTPTEATSYNRIGLAYDIAGNYDSAVYYYLQSYNKRIILLDSLGAANVLLNIGAAYYTEGFYNLSLKYYLDCAKLIGTLKDNNNSNKTLAKVYNNIGLIHRVKKEYKEALKWYFKSLQIKAKQNDNLGVLYSFTNISITYQNLRQLNEATAYVDSAYNLIKTNNIENEFSANYINRASILKDKKEYKEALEYLELSLEWLKKHPDSHTLTYAYSQFSEIYYITNNYQKSIEFSKKSIEIAQQVQRREITQSSYELLAKCYEKIGNYKEALIANKNHKLIKDSIFNIESRKSLDEQQIIYNVKKNEKEIALLNVENEKKQLEIEQTKQRMFYSVLLFIISILGALILLYALWSNKKNNKKLEEKNNLINKSLKEKEVLLREIHHRVKNNLQIITGLLELQESLHSNKEIGSLVAEAQGRIKTMSLIHEMLYQNEDISNINLNNYVQRLVSSIEIGFKNNEQTIKKEYDLDNVFLNIDTIIPLGLIINELVSNAYKYVYSTGLGKTLEISISKVNETSYKLIIADDGPGIANDGEGEREGSFGLRLVKMLARQLQGKIDYNHKNGASFSIIFIVLNHTK
ncbi:MAG: tetratricopeptide repeat protein [Bacteroidia bacterium]|nr:tetratricopeptide repeat protein [Bacteroidia bacterium]